LFLQWKPILNFDFTTSTLFLTYSHLWSFTYFFLILYIGLIFVSKTYLIANIKDFTQYSQNSNINNFSYLVGFDLLPLLFSPIFIYMLLNFTWTGPIIFTWFGHLVLSSLQYKILYWLLGWFVLVWCVQISSFYFTTTELYDYLITTYFFVLWLLLLFYSTNLFSFIFFIEILSILILLLLITSTFSTSYFYNITSYSVHTYFQQSHPFSFLQTLLFFFWISLIGSLNLFIFLIFFYFKLATFDWFLTELVFQYLVVVGSLKDFFYLSVSWFIFFFCVFLKCGLAPFYFWKPTFFKGISFHALYVYIFFFYFFLIIYFIYILVILLNEIFYFNIFINFIVTLFGLIMLTFLLFESYYIKVFFALSSILNTLLIFLAISGFNSFDFIFFL